MKGHLQLGLASAFLLLAAGSGRSQQMSTGQQIVEALRQGRNEAALQLSERGLAQHPDDCTLMAMEGLAYTGLGQTDGALKSYTKVLAHCPKYLVALEGAAQIDFARKSPAAVPLLETIISIKSDDPTAHAMLASLLASGGHCNQAMPHFSASAALLQTRPEFQQQYARCLVEQGDFVKALPLFQTLAAAQPSDAATYNVAVLQWKMHQASSALATLGPLLVAEQFQPAFVLGSRISEELGDTPRAVVLIRSAIQLKPDDIQAYVEFSSLAYDHHSFPVGVEMLNAGLQRLPNAAPLYLARGVLEVQMSRIDQALEDFEKAHRLDDRLSFAVDAMGLVQTQQHQDAAALERFQQEAKQHPEDPFLQYLLAEQLSQSSAQGDGNLERAIAAATASTRLDPKYQPAQDLLIVLLMRAKQPALAIDQAERTLVLYPTDESALYQELLARRRLKETDALEALTARLVAARKSNAEKQQKVDRYQLQGEAEK